MWTLVSDFGTNLLTNAIIWSKFCRLKKRKAPAVKHEASPSELVTISRDW